MNSEDKARAEAVFEEIYGQVTEGDTKESFREALKHFAMDMYAIGMRARSVEAPEVDEDNGLKYIADVLQNWLDFHEKEMSPTKVDDSQHIMGTPVWPTREVLKKWIGTLRSRATVSAAVAAERGPYEHEPPREVWVVSSSLGPDFVSPNKMMADDQANAMATEHPEDRSLIL